MLAVAATIPDRSLALAYVAIFGAGSVGGMMVMSALLGAPLVLAASYVARVEGPFRVFAALASVGVGLALAWEIGVDAHLLA